MIVIFVCFTFVADASGAATGAHIFAIDRNDRHKARSVVNLFIKNKTKKENVRKDF